MVTETDIPLPDGRTLHAYDTGADDRLAVFWHHGTPNIGAPPKPLFPVADRLGLRGVSYDRPGYGGSTRRPDRDLASAAADVTAVVDALGIDRFAVVGHSGGGTFALACAAQLPQRVVAAVSIAPLAPLRAEGLDWFAGMSSSGAAKLRAAADGREAREKYQESDPEFDPDGFTREDQDAFAGPWSWLIEVVRPALQGGPAAEIDDDVAYAGPWRFDLAGVTAPVLLLHGGQDRLVPSSHSEWLARHCPTAQLWRRPDDGHISILNSSPAAIEWLRESAR
jgi:pimeloyl-ACP methyl ester carboxylesterase